MSKVEPGGKGFPEQDRPESKPTLKKNPEGLVRMRAQAEKDVINILWFRNGLRLHDNGSLHNATEDKTAKLLPVFIFDGETPVTKECEYNKMKFLLECLEDLNEQFIEAGAKLYCIQGNPEEVLRKLKHRVQINRVCFDQDCEAIWIERDNNIRNYCVSHKIEVFEHIGATLWDPLEIIEANGGTPPLTYSHFCHVTKGIGEPKRPLPNIDLSTVSFYEIPDSILAELKTFPGVPTPEDLGFYKGDEEKVYKGGERTALKYFNRRMAMEKEAFLDGSFLPNRRDPDILNPPKSLSPDLKFGCISVKLFYWSTIDAFNQVNEKKSSSYLIVSQLIWREFYYAMSANNPFFAEMERNPVCINIPWKEDEQALEKFNAARTGYPFIDAGIRQLKKEGWIHHVLRNALSMFMTRGDLWLNWVHGEKLFRTYLIDGDWAVNAGNWLWVSSSAFEKSLNYSYSLDPRVYGRHVDSHGKYIKRYIPELANYPVEYIYTPWKAPLEIQKKAGCIIGKDYPEPMIDHDEAVAQNRQMMLSLQKDLLTQEKGQPNHVRPSGDLEINLFFRIHD